MSAVPVHLPAGRGVLPAWTTAVEGFTSALIAAGKATATITGYARHIEWLAAGVTSGPWSLTPEQLGAWLNGQNWSQETRRKVLVSVRTFYAWAIADGYIEWAPTAGLPRAQQRRRGPQKMPMPPAWRGPFEEHVTSLRSRNVAEGTIGVRRHYLRLLAQASADPWRVTTEQLEAWSSNPEWGPATKRSARSQVSAFYRWAKRVGYVSESPAEDLEPVRVPRGVPRPIAEDPLREALHRADDRVRLMLLLAAYGGLRCAEVAGLHCSQITDTHLIVIGKGGHARMVPLAPGGELATALEVELLRRRDGRRASGWSFDNDATTQVDGWLFPSTRGRDEGRPISPARVGRLMASVLPPGFTPHQLRHRFASAAYEATRDLRAVQELLGHTRPETTARYAAVPDGALLAAVVGAAEPAPRGVGRRGGA